MIYIKHNTTGKIQEQAVNDYSLLSKSIRNNWSLLEDQSEIEAFQLSEAKEKKVASRISYLSKTDWYIAREADQPDTYPQAIKDKRILARQEINQIEACTTQQELDEFNDIFQ